MLLHGGALPLASETMIFAPIQSPNWTTCNRKGCNEMKPCDTIPIVLIKEPPSTFRQAQCNASSGSDDAIVYFSLQQMLILRTAP